MYKIYENGQAFLAENEGILKAHPLDTAFFRYNANIVKTFSRDSYFIKVYNDDSYLLLSRYSIYNLVLYGNQDLCEEAVDVMISFNLEFRGVLSDIRLADRFLSAYEAKLGGSHYTKLSLDLMYCMSNNKVFDAKVENCTHKDYSTLIHLVHEFQNEASRSIPNCDDIAKMVAGLETNFFCIRENDEIIAIAKKTRIEEDMCAISAVYTKKEYRNKGYATALVSYVTDEIINEGKIAYLYESKSREISNNIFQNIGYSSYIPRVEIIYDKGNIRTLILALNHNAELADFLKVQKGITRVELGYAGGLIFNPDKELIEKGLTRYRRSLVIEYDISIIPFEKLMDLYFSFIDPFDPNDCFALFSSNMERITAFRNKMLHLEMEARKRCQVDIMPGMVFYKK